MFCAAVVICDSDKVETIQLSLQQTANDNTRETRERGRVVCCHFKYIYCQKMTFDV